MVASVLILACSDPAPDPPEPPPAPAEAPTVAPPAPVAVPIPGEIRPGAVSLVGFGMGLTLNPPFQAARIGPGVMVSHWDVTATGAGVSDVAGLYTLRVIPKLPAAPDAAWSTEERRRTDDKSETLMRHGTDGTEILFPVGSNALGGLGTVIAGPTTEGLQILVDGEAVDWPMGLVIVSTDPSTGPGYAMSPRPGRPWGPWPDLGPVPAPSGSLP